MHPINLPAISIHCDMVTSIFIGTWPCRCRDFTPTSFQTDTYPDSGSAENFVKFLETELVPHIDGKYRTIPDADHRGLYGGSLGGLFTCHMGLKHPGTFRKYIASSPSLWWDNGVMNQYENEYAQGHTELNVLLYVATSDSEDPIMLLGHNQLVAQLQSRNYTGFSLYAHVLHGLAYEETGPPDS
jgi:predicted alpha/beta superfamily hydrolase